MKKGFTLVELSIVIIIIGLIIAGVTAGQSLVDQAQLRATITEIQTYQTAYKTFVDKYDAVPGDMVSAETIWPAPLCGAMAGACVGNGDGKIQTSQNAGTAGTPGDEVRPALKILALAGLINGNIAQVPASVIGLTAGVNAPISKYAGSGYYICEGDTPSTGSDFNGVDWVMPIANFFPSTTNVLFIGANATYHGTIQDNLIKPGLTIGDAFSIDEKIDDGMVSNGVFTGASSGKFMSVDGAQTSGCANLVTNTYYAVTLQSGDLACLSGLALN
ncbi:MAG: prepilin-type N-terminal cleavage/methylation domain-containing protein [Rickettsiales bacterium]